MPEKPRHVINISEKFSADDEKQVERAIKFGQISALHNVRRWLLWWLAAISVLFALAGFFGVEKMISDRIGDKISAKVDEVGVEKMVSEQVGDEVSAKVDDEVSAKVDENPVIEVLSGVNNQDLATVLRKIIDDFTNVKDLRLRVHVQYDEDVDLGSRDRTLFAIHNIDMRKSEEEDVARFRVDDASLAWMGNTGLAYDLHMHPLFRDIYGEDISGIQTRYLRFRDHIRPDEKFDVYEELEYVRVQIVLNGVIIFDRKIEDLEFTKRGSGEEMHLESVYDIGDSLHDPRSALMAAIKGDE